MDYEEYTGEVLPLDSNKSIDSLVSAITRVESGGNTEAKSSQGARGSMQIMPATFKQYAKAGENYENDSDRRAAAIRKIRDDFAYYDGDTAKTAAAYLGGRGAVRKDGTIRDDVSDALGTTPVKYANMVTSRMKGNTEEYTGKVLPLDDKYEEYTGEVLPLPNSSSSIINGGFKNVEKPTIGNKAKSFYAGNTDTEPEEYSDPMGTGNTSGAAQESKPKSTGSIIMDGQRLDSPDVDAVKNRQARDKSGSPESVMYQPARDLDAADAVINRTKRRETLAAEVASMRRRELIKQANAEANDASRRLPTPDVFDPAERTAAGEDAMYGVSPPKSEDFRMPSEIAKDFGAAGLKIGPTALKSLAQIYSMGTGGLVGDESAKLMDTGIKAIDATIGSKASEKDRVELSRLLSDENANAADIAAYVASKPMLMADMGITTVGSMFVPAGVTGLLGKIAKVPLSAKTATTVSNVANATMNAADTFDETNADNRNKYIAAAIAGLGSYGVGKATGGGAEGMLSRQVAGAKSAKPIRDAITGALIKEPLQEAVENASQKIGQDIGEGKDIDWQRAGKEAALGAMVAPLVAAPVSIREAHHGNPKNQVIDELSSALNTPLASQEINFAKTNPNLASKPTPADIISPNVTSVDQAVDTFKASVQSSPVTDNIKSTIAERSNNALNEVDRSYLEAQAKQDIAEINAKEDTGLQLTPEEISHRSYLADSINPETSNGTEQAGVNHGAIARKIGYTAGEAELANQIKASKDALTETKTEAENNANSQAATEAEATQARAPERVEPAASSTTNTTARTSTLEATRINDANTVQAQNGAIPDANSQSTATRSAVADGGRLLADRLEPALQPEPKMVQGVPKESSVTPRADITEDQRQKINAASEKQLESLYQQDVKDTINQRLGRTDLVKEKPKLSQFKSFLRQHGIRSSLAADVTGERGLKANNLLPATFRNNGLQMDMLVERAVEDGFLSEADIGQDGGEAKLIDLIQREIRGERHTPSDYNEENSQAKNEASQRAEIESMADKLRLPYAGDISTDRLASMVKRVNDRLEAENLKSWGETKDGKPLGKLKEERVLQQAKEFSARIEQKRVQYERDLDGYAQDNIKIQDFVLDVLLDKNGLPIVTKISDVEAVEAWLQENKDWNNDYGTDPKTNRDTRQAETPESQRAGESASGAQASNPAEQRGSAESQVQKGLTAPTREDILTQQERAAQADKDQAAADKATEKAAKQAADKKEIDARQEASAENFQLGQSAEDSISGQASMFDAPRTEADIEQSSEKLRDDAEAAYLAKSGPKITYSDKELTSVGDITITVQTDTGNAKMTLNAKKYLASLDERAEALNEVKRCLG
jgi:Transglycosylase SLT domain